MTTSTDSSTGSRFEDFGLTGDHALMRRIAIAMLAFGGALEIMYSAAFSTPDWTDAAAVGLTVLATAWVLIVRWETASPRMLVPPMLMGIAAVVFIVIGDSVAVGMSFLFLPAALVMVFFWQDFFVKVAVILPLSIAYIAVPAIWGDRTALIEAGTTLPLMLGIGFILGALFHRFRNASVEQARFRGTITALLMALDARDDHSTEHSSEVLSLVMAVADDIGLDDRETLHAADVALLHDIGKIGIPNEILDKPAPLSEDEWIVMRRHPEIGERILNVVPGFEAVANAVRHEHERWDGTGYPDGLKGEEIPVASRIVLACDAYHAMLSERPYRAPLTEHQAREQLRLGSGSQFDPDVVDALIAAIEALEGRAPQAQQRWRETIEDGVVDNLRVLRVDGSDGRAVSL